VLAASAAASAAVSVLTIAFLFHDDVPVHLKITDGELNIRRFCNPGTTYLPPTFAGDTMEADRRSSLARLTTPLALTDEVIE
jgi:hypothetical protein